MGFCFTVKFCPERGKLQCHSGQRSRMGFCSFGVLNQIEREIEMSEDVKELKKELAKRKRMAVEIASEIHDIVEDTLWTDAVKMPELSAKLLEAVNEANSFKEEHGL
jgi:hypothetical protein